MARSAPGLPIISASIGATGPSSDSEKPALPLGISLPRRGFLTRLAFGRAGRLDTVDQLIFERLRPAEVVTLTVGHADLPQHLGDRLALDKLGHHFLTERLTKRVHRL